MGNPDRLEGRGEDRKEGEGEYKKETETETEEERKPRVRNRPFKTLPSSGREVGAANPIWMGVGPCGPWLPAMAAGARA